MKASPVKKPAIRLAVVESDPLRFVGFRALFDSETDLELIAASLPDIANLGISTWCCWATATARTCLTSWPA